MSVRFYAVSWWEEEPALSGAGRYSLGSAPGSGNYDTFDLYRFPGISGSSTATAWQAQYVEYTGHLSSYAPVMTSEPRPQKAAGYDGMIGQFHYSQVGNGSQTDVTMWVGQVNGDRVVMIFQCDPARDQFLDQAASQVLATIDFNAA
jgi:hypothetical protein